MVEDEKKTSTKKEVKRQKVKINISVYREGNNILSAIGIPNHDTVVIHDFQKSKMKKEGWFLMAEFLQNNKVLPHGTENRVIKDILNLQKKDVELPPMAVSKLPNIGHIIHEVLHVEIEL